MSSVVKWFATVLSRGTVLTTELSTLTNGSYSAVGPVYDNTTNLDKFGYVKFLGGGSITPTTGAAVRIFLVNSLDLTNYDDPASATNPSASQQLVEILTIATGAHTPQSSSSRGFVIPSSKFKFVLQNQTGVSLSASGNTLTLYTSNEAVG